MEQKGTRTRTLRMVWKLKKNESPLAARFEIKECVIFQCNPKCNSFCKSGVFPDIFQKGAADRQIGSSVWYWNHIYVISILNLVCCRGLSSARLFSFLLQTRKLLTRLNVGDSVSQAAFSNFFDYGAIMSSRVDQLISDYFHADTLTPPSVGKGLLVQYDVPHIPVAIFG